MWFNVAVKVVAVNLLAIMFYTSQVASSSPNANLHHWYTSPTINNIFTGNRILSSDSSGSFPSNVNIVDVILPSDVKWLVATTLFTSNGQNTNEEEAQFVATTQDGLAYLISANGTVDQILDYSKVSDGSDVDQPPLVSTYIDEASNQQVTKIIQLPNSNLSSLSCPTHVFESIYIYINISGDVILYDLATGQVLSELQGVNALLDGRIIEAPQNVFDTNNSVDMKTKLFAVYGGSTSFSHCVLGDCIEGSTLIFIQVSKQQQSNNSNSTTYQMSIQRTITLPTNTVYEGLYPMFIQNGMRIVTTVANSTRGAWLRVYNVCTGEILSESNYLGWGWRHMLFYNNFAPLDDVDPLYSLVDVLTPHVRKQLEFFDISSSPTMELQTSTSKYTTHDIGWRNLDTGISGDLNGDGINEAILLDENLENMVSFQLVNNSRDSFSEEEVWRMPLVGRLTSNIAAVSYDGGIGLAAASGNKVRLWISPSTTSSQDGAEKEEATSSTSTTMTVISSSTTFPPELTTDSTTTSTDMSTTTTSTYGSNDVELGISTSNSNVDQTSEPKNCGVQASNVATQSTRISVTALVLIALVRCC